MNGTLGSNWWSAWSSGLARQVELWALVAIGLALVWLLLLMLLHRRDRSAEAARASGRFFQLDAAGLAAAGGRVQTFEGPALGPVAAGAGANGAAAAGEPRVASLSPPDLIALASLRARIESGRVTEDPLDARHL